MRARNKSKPAQFILADAAAVVRAEVAVAETAVKVKAARADVAAVAEIAEADLVEVFSAKMFASFARTFGLH